MCAGPEQWRATRCAPRRCKRTTPPACVGGPIDRVGAGILGIAWAPSIGKATRATSASFDFFRLPG